MTDKEKKEQLEERAQEIKWAIILVLMLIALVLLLR